MTREALVPTMRINRVPMCVDGLVHPAALAAGWRLHLLDRLPESERAVGDRQLGSDRRSTSFQIKEKFSPGLGTLAHAVLAYEIGVYDALVTL